MVREFGLQYGTNLQMQEVQLNWFVRVMLLVPASCYETVLKSLFEVAALKVEIFLSPSTRRSLGSKKNVLISQHLRLKWIQDHSKIKKTKIR